MLVQNLRAKIATLYGVIPLSILVLFISLQSCSKSSIATPSFSGEELFEGIFFGKGSVAKLIPEIQETTEMLDILNPAEREEYEEITQEITDHIRTHYPSFFIEFKQRIQSGDHFEIKEELQRASEIVVSFVNNYIDVEALKESSTVKDFDINKFKNGELSKSEIRQHFENIYANQNEEKDQAKGRCVVAAVVVVAVGAVAVAVIAAVVVATWAWVTWANRRIAHSGDLYGEKVVNSIALNLVDKD